MARRRHDELPRRDMGRDGARDILMRMRRSHDEDEVGAGDRGAGIVGDERERREAVAERAFIFDTAGGGQGLGGSAAAAIETYVEATMRQIGRRGTATVARADDGNGLDRRHGDHPMRYFAIFASSTSMPRPGPSGT